MAASQIAVLIPAVGADIRAEHLDEANAALDQSPRQEALGREKLRRGISGIHAVQPFGSGGFAAQVEQFRHRSLHAKSQLVVGDGGFDLVLVRMPVGARFIQLMQERQFLFLPARLRFLGPQVGDRFGPMLKYRTLKRRRQKSVAETIQPTRRDESAIEHDEAGQIAALASQTVGCPGAHARPALLAVTGVDEVVGVGVLREVRGHRTNHHQVVNALGNVWE